MSTLIKEPTYHRLNAAFKLLGPYLREEKYQGGVYHFDCLAVCVNEKASPESREFWGWWMVLTQHEYQFEAKYAIGRYDVSGNWIPECPQDAAMAEVIRTRDTFHEKLVALLKDQFQSEIIVCNHSSNQ
jgi:sigma factor-binding protein Crl